MASSITVPPGTLSSEIDKPEASRRTLTFWRNGFSIDDGPLMLLEGTASEEALHAIQNGRSPTSLFNVKSEEEVNVDVRLRRHEDYPYIARVLEALNPVSQRDQHENVRDELKRIGIDATRAELAALNELRFWAPQQVKSVFETLAKDWTCFPLGPAFNKPGAKGWKLVAIMVFIFCLSVFAYSITLVFVIPHRLLTGKRNEIKPILASLREIHTSIPGVFFYIKPPLHKIREAARKKQALCVNRHGNFELRASGYMAVSHVWAEMLGWIAPKGEEMVPMDDRGLNKEHFTRIFDTFSRAGSEWMWFDLLAVPSNLEPGFKTDVINTMSDVYRNADAVVIFDALALQFESRSVTDVAVALTCGQWITRIWTYQEIKLAKDAWVITAKGRTNFGATIRQLEALAQNDSSQYTELYKTFRRLQHGPEGISLPDIALACQNRTAGVDKDYARAFFPTLGLTWEPGYDRVEGMMQIMQSQPYHAARIAAMHGVRGFPSPYGWAPAYLSGLEGVVRDGMNVTESGLEGTWFTTRVANVKEKFRHGDEKTVLTLKVLDEAVTREVQIIATNGMHLRTDRTEKIRMDDVLREALDEWESAIGIGCGHIFCKQPMHVTESTALQVLLVSEDFKAKGPTDLRKG